MWLILAFVVLSMVLSYLLRTEKNVYKRMTYRALLWFWWIFCGFEMSQAVAIIWMFRCQCTPELPLVYLLTVIIMMWLLASPDFFIWLGKSWWAWEKKHADDTSELEG